MCPCRIVRDDGGNDGITRGSYADYNAAHAVLERYYADLCCSDEREYYRIEEERETGTDLSAAPARDAAPGL